jgi:lipopolysaccharide export system protein LptA
VQLTRVEAKGGVIITSKKGQDATAQWATFDVMANTALLGGRVTVTRVGEDPLKVDVVRGERLKVDLTTGILSFEIDGAPSSQQPASPTPRP